MTEISKQLQQEVQLRKVKEQPWAGNKKASGHNYVFGSGSYKPSKIDLAQVSVHLLVTSVIIYFLINVFA